MYVFKPRDGANYKFDYQKIAAALNDADHDRAVGIIRKFSKTDLLFLVYFVFGIMWVNHPWVVARIREVEEKHDRTLDLWPREYGKSLIITQALSIQQLLNNPEERIGILSHTREVAQDLMMKIASLLEKCQLLIHAFPEILYADPRGEANRAGSQWGEKGITVKRQGSYNECSVEAYGLDALPNMKHWTIRAYDDLVTKRSISSSKHIEKVKSQFRDSQFLGERGGSMRAVGTIYHWADLHCDMIKSGHFHVRKYPAEVDGQAVFWSQEELARKKQDLLLDDYDYQCQMLLDPTPTGKSVFDPGWLKYYERLPGKLFHIILVDPARAKKEHSDYTVMLVVGVDNLGNYFVVDMIRDRLDLGQKWDKLRGLVDKYKCRTVVYERVGMTVDIEYLNMMMQQMGIYFDIIATGSAGRNAVSKTDRIKTLIPLFRAGRILLPRKHYYLDENGETTELIEEFIDTEYTQFPFSRHDDTLDALSYILDQQVAPLFPAYSTSQKLEDDVEDWRFKINPLKSQKQYSLTGWMGR